MHTRLMQWVKSHRQGILCACGILGAYLCMFACGITCPIKALTGISCPGCGLTRAWLHALTFDWSGALAYHPLFWLVPIALVLFWLEKRSRTCKIAFYTIVALAFAVWLVRLLDPADTVAVFAPADGVIGRVVQKIFSLF